jgi:hypothetical protein
MRSKETKSKQDKDALAVVAYMNELDHTLKKEIEVVRNIIRGADKKISERIKWNAPSYYYKEDLVTFNLRDKKVIHLVFHNRFIAQIKSDLLQGDYVDRRMVYFKSMDEIIENRTALEKVVKQLVKFMDQLPN